MQSLEKRIAALELVSGSAVYQLTDAELQALIDSSLAKMGTTMAEQIALYGSEQAMLTVMCKQANGSGPPAVGPASIA